MPLNALSRFGPSIAPLAINHQGLFPAMTISFNLAPNVPLSEAAQMEAAKIMSANKNILKPGSGDVVVASKLLDIVLGCYWMTKTVEGMKGEGNAFPSTNAAITAHDFGAIDLRAHATPR